MAEDELTQLAQSRIGRVLKGKYRLDRVLGIGGMAVVYAATHRNRKRVAIKMLHPELSVRENVRTRFLREGYVANSVDHPGAVAVLDDDVAEDGSAFVVMELLDGAPVDAVHEKHGKTVPVPLALSIGDALLDVLVSAHAKGIVHRDIKPANLFLTSDGRLEVLDFGIARLHDETSSAAGATQTGAMMGTPAYMAPEQALAESSNVDAQTDLWAVGATLFVLLTGELVHLGDNASKLLIAAATQKARPIASIATDLPAPIAAVVDRALAFDKAQRWASAKEMRDALAKACLDATGAPIAPLPKTEKAERMTGLEETIASSQDVAPGSRGIGFEPTLDPSSVASGASPAKGQRTPATVDPLSATRPSAVAPTAPPKGSLRWPILGGVAVALVVGVAIGLRHAPSTTAATPQASSSAEIEPKAGRPPGTPAAAAAYDAAMTALRDGNLHKARQHFDLATQSDPALGAAYLRFAVLGDQRASKDARERAAYQKAVEQRATLSEVDTAILDAWEPRFHQPPDREESLKKMQGVAAQFPRDVFVQYLDGYEEGWDDHDAAADAAYDRALAIDPRYAAAYSGKIDVANDRGDTKRATELVEQCLKVSPSSTMCLEDRWTTASDEGRCEDARADARRLVALDPSSRNYQFELAQTLAALGEPAEVVGEVLRNAGAALTDPDERREWELVTAARIALLAGDFPAADKALGEDVAWTSAHPTLATWFWSGATQVNVAFEVGDQARARSLLKALRARMLAKQTGDWTDGLAESYLVYQEERAGVSTRAQLRAWQATMLTKIDPPDEAGAPTETWKAWTLLYRGTDDAQGAVDALASLPRYFTPVPEGALHEADVAGLFGRLYALAGRGADAVPLLRRATASCAQLDAIDDSMYWWSYLGMALEQTGDVAGAREAYGKILARWGDAKPRSVLADKARAAIARLGPKK
jgi:serine/threonine-protein kinase